MSNRILLLCEIKGFIQNECFSVERCEKKYYVIIFTANWTNITYHIQSCLNITTFYYNDITNDCDLSKNLIFYTDMNNNNNNIFIYV